MVRADSLRNRERILTAAGALLAARGEGVGMDEIAAEAGVAVGTLYRHFPTKSDLIAAALAELTERLVADVRAAADRVENGADPAAELRGLLEWLITKPAADKAIKAAATGLASDALQEMESRGFAELDRITAVAHAHGLLRPDITTADFALIAATAPDDTLPAAARDRWIELALRSVLA
ncbi:TetR/AcrR family transcriptional regulator [Streptomyces sp. NPDC096176]|uniref:TetR/AcrR family transcriptional regulator n=1 Tax=Streptomyces sp. NPDC096176 TaxID=3366079 RepID=UPI0037F7D1ED